MKLFPVIFVYLGFLIGLITSVIRGEYTSFNTYLGFLIFVSFVIFLVIDPTFLTSDEDDSNKLKRARNLAKHKEYEALDKLLDIDRGDSNA